MVFFTCNACGSSLKKNQVEKHSYRCRGCQYMTCIDCSKDFWGTEYTSHKSCISENEKYGGTNYVAKENSGQKKQDAWMKLIMEAIVARDRYMNPQVRNFLQRLCNIHSIPRKKEKFMNVAMQFRNDDKRLCEKSWEFLESIQNTQSNEIPENHNVDGDAGPSNSNGILAEKEVEPPRKNKRERKEERRQKQGKPQKKNKRKRDDSEADDVDDSAQCPKKSKKKKKREEEANQENEEPVEEEGGPMNEESFTVEHNLEPKAFKWKVAISTVLQDAPEEGMKLKKLKRKVFALYLESKEGKSYRKSDLEIEALISKKLQMRNDKFVMLKDRVKLKKSS